MKLVEMLGERYLLGVAVVTILFCVMIFTNDALPPAFGLNMKMLCMSVSRVSF